MVDFKVEGLTVAVTNMEKMLAFYQTLFGMAFERDERMSTALGLDLYRTELPGGLKVLFCPNELAGVSAQQNRQQWDLIAGDFDRFFDDRLTQLGGAIKTPPRDQNGQKVGAIMDPDGNTIVLKSQH